MHWEAKNWQHTQGLHKRAICSIAHIKLKEYTELGTEGKYRMEISQFKVLLKIKCLGSPIF